MIKKIQSILLIILGIIFLNACQKELTGFDINTGTPGTNSGTAKYSFLGGTGGCAGAEINGVYNKGTALTTTNTIIIKVNVDSIGTYSIATANINGIIFGSSGNFTATGAQTIILKGAGTPIAAGNFNFTPGAKGCFFSITFTANGTTNGSAQFTLNGAPDSCVNPKVSGNYFVGLAMTDADTVVIKANVTTPGSYTITSNAVNGILFSATGIFTTSGQQTVTLKATGKPIADGVFSFTPGTNGCKFAINFIAPTDDCKECIYLPFCVGSKYEYEDTIFKPNFIDNSFTSQVNLHKAEFISAIDTTIDGSLFKKINTFNGVNNDYTYVNCTNGETRVIASNITSLTSSNVIVSVNSIELKANAAEGTTWSDTSIIGGVNELYRKHTIIKKGFSKIVFGKTYNDVIEVRIDQSIFYTDPAAGLVDAGFIEFYLAKGVGNIETIGFTENPFTNENYVFYHSVLKSYSIP